MVIVIVIVAPDLHYCKLPSQDGYTVVMKGWTLSAILR